MADISSVASIGVWTGLGLGALYGVLEFVNKRRKSGAEPLDASAYMLVIEELGHHADNLAAELQELQKQNAELQVLMQKQNSELQVRIAVLVSENRGLQTQVAELRASLERAQRDRQP